MKGGHMVKSRKSTKSLHPTVYAPVLRTYYIAESPKQGSKRFNFFVKTIGFDHLVIIYLCSTVAHVSIAPSFCFCIYLLSL